MRSLKLHRTDVTEGLMQPLPIVEDLDELKHVRLDFLSRVILPLMHQLILERTEETLHGRIVVAVPLAAHAGYLPGLRQLPLVRHTGVGGALIGVMDQPGPQASVGDGHLQCRECHVLIRTRAHGHPITRREYRSRITAKHTQPARGAIAVRLRWPGFDRHL